MWWDKCDLIQNVWERKLNFWRRPPLKTIFGPLDSRCTVDMRVVQFNFTHLLLQSQSPDPWQGSLHVTNFPTSVSDCSFQPRYPKPCPGWNCSRPLPFPLHNHQVEHTWRHSFSSWGLRTRKTKSRPPVSAVVLSQIWPWAQFFTNKLRINNVSAITGHLEGSSVRLPKGSSALTLGKSCKTRVADFVSSQCFPMFVTFENMWFRNCILIKLIFDLEKLSGAGRPNRRMCAVFKPLSDTAFCRVQWLNSPQGCYYTFKSWSSNLSKTSTT